MNHPPSHRPHQLAGITTAAGLAAAAALTLLGAPPAAAAAAADTAPPQLGRVTFSRAAVNVSGLNVVPVTVSVRLSDPSGISEIPQAMTPSPHLTLGPVPGSRSQLHPVLTRTSGSSTDGVWSATVGVPSTWNGVVRVTSVGATDGAGNVLYADRTGTRTPALRVRGTHRPADR